MPKMTINDFNKQLAKLGDRTKQISLLKWNQATLETRGLAQSKAPLASGALVRSITDIKAKITDSGLTSYIVSFLPYAYKLHEAASNKTWKEKGEISWYQYGGGHAGKKRGIRRGQKWIKARKGETKFVNNAVKENSNIFVDAVKDAITEYWNNMK